MQSKLMINPMVLAGCVAILVCAASTAQDSVRMRDGKTISGRIEAENYDGLLLKAKKGDSENVVCLVWTDVADINYGGLGEYQQAVTQIAKGNPAGMAKLQGLVAGTGLRKELKPMATIQLVLAMQRAGKFAEAANVAMELVKAFPKTRYLLPAAQAVVECQIAVGDPAAGQTSIETMAGTALAGGVDPAVIQAFDYFRGRLFEAQGNRMGARGKYQVAASLRDAPAAMVAMARLGIARCDRAEGRVDEARNGLRALTEKEVDNEACAGAWNELAEMAMDEASKSRSMEKLTDAVFMYLRGVVEYGPAPGESSNEYERALAGASGAFEALAALETDVARKKMYDQRCRQRLDQLRKEFPNSRFLPK